jgi:hypothetical protein
VADVDGGTIREGVAEKAVIHEMPKMATSSKRPAQALAPSVLFAALPGPTRKRLPSPYCYRLTFRNPDPGATGCALLWDVLGGRDVYQVSLERLAGGALRWHCTCADAVYRGETKPHPCKHVRGLQVLGRPAPSELGG